jgi:hypothetical protein
LVRGLILHVNREENRGIGGLRTVHRAVALLECSTPGVEGGNGNAMAFAKRADRESAALPSFD